MTTYAEVQGDSLILYPYTFVTLQAQNPYTNFGSNTDVEYWFPMTETAIDNNYSLAPVTILPEPSYDPSTEIAVQNTLPTLIDGVWTLGWTVSLMTPEQKAAYDQGVKSKNQSQAQTLLANTDWTAIPSVADPAQSNPYLSNQAAFLAYRSQVRQIAVNPPITPVTDWPTIPDEVWATV